MDVAKIRRVGNGINRYLAEFSDCFGRCDTEAYLGVYVEGQNSDLQRKSAEPIALRAGIVPRSLQVFLGTANWHEERMIDRVQEIVARDHRGPYAIGLIDETGSPKKGTHTACVQRQWNGNRGKVDNCVVSVHLGYTAGTFHSLLDSDLFLPKSSVGCVLTHLPQRTGPREMVRQDAPYVTQQDARAVDGRGTRRRRCGRFPPAQAPTTRVQRTPSKA